MRTSLSLPANDLLGFSNKDTSMISINADELCAIVQSFAHEVSDESGDILRHDWRVIECLETIEAIAKRTDGLTEKLHRDAGLFCLTFEDVLRRAVGEVPAPSI